MFFLRTMIVKERSDKIRQGGEGEKERRDVGGMNCDSTFQRTDVNDYSCVHQLMKVLLVIFIMNHREREKEREKDDPTQ